MNEYGLSWFGLAVFIPVWTALVLLADRVQQRLDMNNGEGAK